MCKSLTILRWKLLLLLMVVFILFFDPFHMASTIGPGMEPKSQKDL